MRVAWRRIPGVGDGPALFGRLTGESEEAVYLDSCGRGRYDVLAWDPVESVALDHGEGRDPFAALEGLSDRVPAVTDAPADAPPFLTGVVGYLAYEAAWDMERIGEPKERRDPVRDVRLMIPGKTLVLDHDKGESWAVVTTLTADPAPLLAELAAEAGRGPGGSPPPRSGELLTPMVPEIGPGTYRDRIRRVQAFIGRGDIYQANFAYRVEGRVKGNPWDLYRVLRQANPGAYAAFLRFPGYAFLSSSPEQFLRWRGNEIETRPIKGTRPRGATPAADRRYRDELANSEKDQAELVMIVDLERNDFGRFCETGSVRVPELCAIHPHATVWHQSSLVTGRLPRGTTAGTILRAAFPGGSITGAPKIRSMQVIRELEYGRRGVYTGSIGYVDARGSAEWNVAIRTLTWAGTDEATLSYHVGGGIVADSDPDLEYAETLAKGRGMARAVKRWTSVPAGQTPIAP